MTSGVARGGRPRSRATWTTLRSPSWIGEATRYGLHCTITGGAIQYDDADTDEIKDRLASIAGRVPPFTLTDGRFYDDFHAKPKALVCDFISADGALDRLQRLAATMINPLHTAAFCRPSRDATDQRAAELFTRFGEAWVLERLREAALDVDVWPAQH